MQKRVADYIASILVDNGIDTVFTVVGGGAMHLNDAFGGNPQLQVLHNHHEQACAMGAEGYARIKEKPAVVCVTTGPGGTNALTGVLGAYQDNVPMVVISGQVRYATTVENSGLNLRQFGEQEYYITRSVAPMTKFAYMVKDTSEVRYVLEKALYLATHGRRGPVWIDVPLNIQGAIVETDELKGFVIPKQCMDYRPIAEMILKKMQQAKAPLILAGASIRRSGAYQVFRELVDKLQVPVVSPTCVADILPLTHSLYFQNFGVVGGRTGNFLVQNADVILSLGCRLSLNQIGFNFEAFAPHAYKIVVDVHSDELKKQTLKIDLPVQADLYPLLQIMNQIVDRPYKPVKHWLEYAELLKKKFNLMDSVKNNGQGINPYILIRVLMNQLPSNAVVVTGNSSGSAMALHYGIAKDGQRLFTNRNCGSMGYDLPAALGAAVARQGMVVCLTGDGSIQMNLQELQTMVLNKIPVKIMIYNNNGYMGIVRTQTNFFNGRLSGCTPESGLSCPRWKKIAYAYDIPYICIENTKELEEKLTGFLNQPGFALCELIEDSSQGPAFKTTSKKLDNGEMVSAPLDELSPALDEDEFKKYRYYEKYSTEEQL